MSNLLEKQLIEFGLSEKEAKVYLALLELEIAAVSEIAKTANINRSSTYVVLNSLKKKGLIGTSEDKKIQRYVATSPEMLLREAEDRAQKSENIKNKISDIIPELKSMHKDTKHRPIVRVFDGKKGLREIYWDILYTKEAKELKTFSDPTTIFRMFPNFMEQALERTSKGIKMYAVCPATKEVLELCKNAPSTDEIITIPYEKFKSSNNVAIYGNKIALASPKEEFGIIIENKEIADVMKNIFDLSWQEAKRLHQKILKKIYKSKSKKSPLMRIF